MAYAYGRFSLLRPRRPASGDCFNPSVVTKHLGLGFGLGFGFGFGFGSGLGHGSWPEAGSESCETRTLRAGANGARRNTAGRHHGSCASRFGTPEGVEGGMTQTPPPATSLPHHKLFAYELCLSLVELVAKVRVADAQLRAQARKSAASAALNCAEGAARQTRADKSRAYAIALCECCEACAAIEIAGALGACSAADVQAVVALGTRTKNILSRLVC